jgi:hypothetical protein
MIQNEETGLLEDSPSGVVLITGTVTAAASASYDLGTIDDIYRIEVAARTSSATRFTLWMADSILGLADIADATHLWKLLISVQNVSPDGSIIVDVPWTEDGVNAAIPRYIGVAVDNVIGMEFNGGLNCYRRNGGNVVAIGGLA